MKEGWEIKNIGEICEVIPGQSPKSKFYNKSGEGLPFYQGKKEFTAKYIDNPKTWTTNITKEAHKDDILMSVRAPVGPVNFATQKICIGRGLSAIRAGKTINRNFLFYFFIKHKSEITGNNGAVFNSINRDQIKAIKIPLPSLAEQKRIVAILDEAFAAIDKAKANAEKNLSNAKELFESYLNGIFANPGEDWEEKKLGEVCTIKHGFAFEGKFFSNKGNYVLLTPGNFYEEGGYRHRGDKQKYYTGEIPQDFILEKGDLLIAMTEQAHGLLGSSMIVPEHNKFLHNQRLGLVRPTESVVWNTEFIALLFNTIYIRNKIEASASGVKVRHTSPKRIGDIIVRIPMSLSVQKDIVNKANVLKGETKHLEPIYQQKLTALDELKKSILKKAFEGKL